MDDTIFARLMEYETEKVAFAGMAGVGKRLGKFITGGGKANPASGIMGPAPKPRFPSAQAGMAGGLGTVPKGGDRTGPNPFRPRLG